jgi:translation elongation factor aEF-1 beta
MGKVAVTFKIMSDTIETDMFDLKDEIAKKVKIQDYHVEAIAFGIKVLRVLVVTDDSGTSGIEEQIKSVKGVSEVEVESSTLL